MNSRLRLREVGSVFLRLGLTSFGGPAAHVALIQRECVERRQWITTAEFLDLLAVSSLIPGPTSTELAMHVGRVRAGWWGLGVAGIAFIAPASLLVACLAWLYVRSGDIPAARGVLAAVQPVVVVLVAQALVPLARSALRTPAAWMIGGAAAALVVAGIPEIYVLIAAGAVALARRPAPIMLAGLVAATTVATVAVTAMADVMTAAVAAAMAVAQIDAPLAAIAGASDARAAATDVAAYFFRIGSLLFGSGYVLLPVLQGDLVNRYGWVDERELLDAIAAGQATPGPLFKTATFIGYLLGGPAVAAAATVAMFTPAFVFSAAASALLPRLRRSARARAFLDGVNAAAVALIGVVLVTLGRAVLDGALPGVIAAVAGVALFAWRVNAGLVLAAAALAGALYGLTSA